MVFAQTEQRHIDRRKFVIITNPVFSLKELCFNQLRSMKMRENELKSVDLPLFLKDEYYDYLANPNRLRLLQVGHRILFDINDSHT